VTVCAVPTDAAVSKADRTTYATLAPSASQGAFRSSPRDFAFRFPHRLTDQGQAADPAILVFFFVTEQAATSFANR
jgi:hypothetical protein